MSTPPQPGPLHGPWHLTWEEHDRRHRALPLDERAYVLDPGWWPDEAWCARCGEYVLLPGAVRD